MKNLNDFKLTKTASENVLGGLYNPPPPPNSGTWQNTHSGDGVWKDYID